MNTGVEPLSPESIDAIILTASALFLILLAGLIFVLLSWCAEATFSKNPTSAKERASHVRLGTALVITKIVLALHFLNIGMFMFLSSGWQALAGWNNRLLPERANALVMLISYYLILAICTLTRRDITQQLRRFTSKTGTAGGSGVAKSRSTRERTA